jgi:RimJ/RimL family protein N-acetyltransferase
VIVQGPEVVEWVAEKTGIVVHDRATAIGYVKDRHIIAGVSFERYTGKCIIGHQRIDEPAPKGFWIACADYAYNKLGVERITGFVDASNDKAMRINYKMGYELEATLQSAGSDGGDLHILVMWKDKCKILDWMKNSK